MSEESLQKKGYAEGFWSDEKVREFFLEQQRKIMWNKDYWKNVLVPLFGLKPDSVVLDVGCGLGFLGQNLAEFNLEGKTIGVDLDPNLIGGAKKMAAQVLPNHVFDFRVGNACQLPLEDYSVDLAICQCVLMHVDDPLEAVSEMLRVTKKGGRVVAIEPDYESLSLFDTAREVMAYSLEEREKLHRWNAILTLGKKKLGKGDNDIGQKMPWLFHKGGLRVVDVRCFDRVFWLVPPYEQEGNDIELEQALAPPEFYFEKLGLDKDFFAGGGTEKELQEFLAMMKKEHECLKQQVAEKTYVSSIAQALIITIGEKT